MTEDHLSLRGDCGNRPAVHHRGGRSRRCSPSLLLGSYLHLLPAHPPEPRSRAWFRRVTPSFTGRRSCWRPSCRSHCCGQFVSATLTRLHALSTQETVPESHAEIYSNYMRISRPPSNAQIRAHSADHRGNPFRRVTFSVRDCRRCPVNQLRTTSPAPHHATPKKSITERPPRILRIHRRQTPFRRERLIYRASKQDSRGTHRYGCGGALGPDNPRRQSCEPSGSATAPDRWRRCRPAAPQRGRGQRRKPAASPAQTAHRCGEASAAKSCSRSSTSAARRDLPHRDAAPGALSTATA